MKIILKNTKVEFVTSKTLSRQSVQQGYMQPTGDVLPGANYTYSVFNVENLSKVRIVGKVGSFNLPLTAGALFKTGITASISNYDTNTAAFDEVIDVLGADILVINSLTTEINNVKCEIIEFDTLNGERIDGTIVDDSILDANGNIETNQYFVVGKYDVSQLKYVNVYTKLNAVNDTAFALKSNGTTIKVQKFGESSELRKSFIVDVRDADEIWVSCIENRGEPSCFAVR